MKRILYLLALLALPLYAAERIPQSVSRRVLLKAYLSSDHISAATSKTVAVVISKNAAAFGNPSGGATNATEIANGWYYVDLSATDTGTLGPLVVRGTCATCDDVEIFFEAVSANNAGFAGIPNAAAEAAGGLYTRGSGAGQINQAVNGQIDSNAVKVGGQTASAAGTVTFPGTIASSTNITSASGVALAASQHVIVDSGTVTTLTNLPAVTADWLTAAGVKADAVTKIQAGLATPTNITAGTITTVTNLTNAPTAGDLTATMKASVTTAASSSTPALSAGGVTAVQSGLATAANLATVDTVVDAIKVKTDYLPSATAGAAGGVFIAGSNAATSVTTALTANITGNLSGSVGSVTGNVSGSIGSLAAQAKADVNAEVDTALNTAIPGSPTADSINERIVAIDAFGAPPAVSAIADGVWDEALSGHSGAGSAGLALSTASSGGVDPSVLADAIWDEALSGHSTAGTAGKKLTDIPTTATLDAAGVRSAVGMSSANLDTQLSGINSKTTNLPSDPADESLIIAATDAIMTRIGAAGAGLTALGDARLANLDAAVSSRGTGAALDAAGVRTAVGLASANLDTQLSGLAPASTALSSATWTNTKAGYLDAAISSISAGSAPTAAQNADAVWDELLSGHAGAGSAGAALTGAGSAGDPWTTVLPGGYTGSQAGALFSAIKAKTDTLGGSGAITWTYTVTNSVTHLPIANVKVWISTDLAGNNIIATTTSDQNGVATFQLDAGTVYVWCSKSGFTFSNPKTKVVAP